MCDRAEGGDHIRSPAQKAAREFISTFENATPSRENLATDEFSGICEFAPNNNPFSNELLLGTYPHFEVIERDSIVLSALN
ncbi:MAG: hypothetical protein DHS20C16_17780 [Phycisphaerae bacterium]|nr:MAG: hypothetical protein DHS20C16_17780 [Phycisphaerae bacterium]